MRAVALRTHPQQLRVLEPLECVEERGADGGIEDAQKASDNIRGHLARGLVLPLGLSLKLLQHQPDRHPAARHRRQALLVLDKVPVIHQLVLEHLGQLERGEPARPFPSTLCSLPPPTTTRRRVGPPPLLGRRRRRAAPPPLARSILLLALPGLPHTITFGACMAAPSLRTVGGRQGRRGGEEEGQSRCAGGAHLQLLATEA